MSLLLDHAKAAEILARAFTSTIPQNLNARSTVEAIGQAYAKAAADMRAQAKAEVTGEPVPTPDPVGFTPGDVMADGRILDVHGTPIASGSLLVTTDQAREAVKHGWRATDEGPSGLWMVDR